MKTQRRIAVSILITLLAFAGPVVSSAQYQKVTLRVDGLACPFCAYGLEKKLKRMDNLDKLDIKINEGLVILYFLDGTQIDKELISQKVKEAGFTPREITVEKKSDEQSQETDGKKVTLSISGMT